VSRKFASWSAALVIAIGISTPGVIQADPLSDCPGSSYSPCHYNFPLIWNLCARCRSRRHADAGLPPPVNLSYYEYRSHCPYADPAALSGFPSLTQRAKLAAQAGAAY
jgi:hypothetical protein